MSLTDHLSRLTTGLDSVSTRPSKERKASSPAPSSLVHFSDEMRQTSQALESLREQVGHALQIEMALCDDGPYHTSPVDPSRVANLKANLQHNEQSTPALLRKKADGRYEIIAGRHRKSALQELGKTHWDAIIKDIDDDTAERLTFYDNLLAPALTDYAKYLGFSQRQASKGLTQMQLAEESGVNQATISRLLSFGKLPPAVLAVVQEHPDLISGAVAAALVPLLDEQGARVLEGINLVAEGKVAAPKLIDWLKATPRVASPKAQESVVHHGEKVFAKIQRNNGRLVIKLSTPSDAEAVQLEIEAVLKKYANPSTRQK